MTMKKRAVLFCGQDQGGLDNGSFYGSAGGSEEASGIHEKEFEQLSRDDHHAGRFSLTDEILPSLGATARSNRRVFLRRFIVSPFDPRYRFLH